MKTTAGKIITIIVGLLVLLFIIRSPQYMKESAIAESVLIDNTDSFAAKPNTNEVLTPLHFDENKWCSITITIQSISNVDYNTVSVLHLSPRIPLVSNPTERDNEIEEYKHKADSVIQLFAHQEYGKSKSSIYRVLMVEVNRIASLNAKRKAVIVYSDLLENSPVFSFYSAQSRALLKSNPDKVRKHFEAVIRPVDLKGTDVYFIFKPRTDINNEYFLMASNLFKSILESAGAVVHVGANLIEP